MNNDPVLHRFRDITTFTAHVTDCDLAKSSMEVKKVSNNKVNFRVIQVHR